MSLHLVTWNVQWATPRSPRRTEILTRIDRARPEVIRLTETDVGLLSQRGHTICSQPDYGYPIREGWRKVMLWSREPWEQVDDAGHHSMPPGRFVSGVTQTSLGPITVVGVCIPWFRSRSEARRGSEGKKPWEDHKRYLAGLTAVLRRAPTERLIVMGDFNQIVGAGRPRTSQAEIGPAPGLPTGHMHRHLGSDFEGRRSIDHLALSDDLAVESLDVISNKHDGPRLSDHFGVVAALSARTRSTAPAEPTTAARATAEPPPRCSLATRSITIAIKRGAPVTATPDTSAAAFAAKWRDNARRERPASQEHFIDLCRLLGVPTPNEADPVGEWYAFEAGAERTSTGRQGRADVWKREHFGWEYKGAHADLAAAYRQLLDYREDLENPPALVVSDMDLIEVHTNFTGTRPDIHRVTLDDLAEGGDRTAEKLRILRAVMLDPGALRPEQTPDEITELAAARFAEIAQSMHERGHEPEAVAHHLNRVVFCLFAEDARLLPERVLTGMIESRRGDPGEFDRGLAELFRLMSDREAGRFFGNERVEWFNGGLFDGAEVIPCTAEELRAMHDAALLDWSRVEPAILGTLFERGLDPDKRGQLGAHYTDHEKILMVVEPVVLDPLRREFAAMRERVEELADGKELSPPTRQGRRYARGGLQPWERRAEDAWRAFLDRLRAVRVLDPACGSGNFLYVTLRLLKDLEQEVIGWGTDRLRIPREFPQVGPHNVLGIELNAYAKELAGVSIWIGHIQWMLDHGYGFPRDPVLQPLDNIEQRDAILARDAEGVPVPATWPAAEFVVGNPPFLGRKLMRTTLGEEYVDSLDRAWAGVIRSLSDFVCYWHELARRRRLLRAPRSGPGCSRRTRFAVAPTAVPWFESRRAATSSWRGRTSHGLSRAQPSASRSSARTTAQRTAHS